MILNTFYIDWRESHFLPKKPRKQGEIFKRVCKHCFEYLDDNRDVLEDHAKTCEKWPTLVITPLD